MGKSLRKQKSQKSQKRWDRERPTIAVDNSYPNEYYDRLELIVSAFPGKVVACKFSIYFPIVFCYH